MSAKIEVTISMSEMLYAALVMEADAENRSLSEIVTLRLMADRPES